MHGEDLDVHVRVHVREPAEDVRQLVGRVQQPPDVAELGVGQSLWRWQLLVLEGARLTPLGGVQTDAHDLPCEYHGMTSSIVRQAEAGRAQQGQG